ncbi:ADAMTS-like protein 2, partial [Dissostichus eleginoides]
MEEVFQWWGEWSSWSSCSRSCGGGVRSQDRHCLIQRLSTTQNINSSYCVGSPKQYQLCPHQPCPSPSVSFKQHQCSQFNSKAFGRRYYQWIPLYPADYISISNKPCDLQCTTMSGERQLLVPAHDGTFCRDTKYHGVCIEGKCQAVGCDGELYSSRTVDRCGMCGGNGTSCQRISGSYRKALTQLGYVFITNIPAGASDIQIIERHKTENILALSDEAGHFFFNGNTVFDNPQNFHVAGTVFKYRRPGNVFSDGLEYIIAQGPTLQGLNYYNLNGKLPHITFEYTTPRTPHDISAAEIITTGHDPQPPPPAAILLYRAADVTSHVFSHNDVEEPGPPGPSGYPLPEDAPYLLLEDLHYNQTHLHTHSLTQSNTHSVEHTLPDPLSLAQTETHSDMLTDTHSATHTERESGTHTGVLVQLQQGPSVQAANTESNDFDVGLEPDISLADMYRWKVSAYAPCSSTCTTGITTSYALCVRYDGSEVDDTYCDSLTRPEPTHEFCTGKECPPRWETSGWSECSRTCGEGVQYRTVRCWKMLSPGLDSSVYDSLCLTHDLHKPANRKVCHGQSCGPQWEVSEWSEAVGCDGELYSSRTVDRCGMCGGNGTSCQRISGSYRKALTQLGYVFITNIPAGASDIQIIERHKTENILVFDNPQNFHVAGTVFKYRRPGNVFSDGLEYIIAQGPTLQGLNYYNLNGKPHITFEYTTPRTPHDISAAEIITTGHVNLTYNGVNGDMIATNHSRGKLLMSPVMCSGHNDVEEPGPQDPLDTEVPPTQLTSPPLQMTTLWCCLSL